MKWFAISCPSVPHMFVVLNCLSTFPCAHDLRRRRCLSYFKQDQFFSWRVHSSCFPNRTAHCNFKFPVWAKHWHRLAPLAAYSKPSAMFSLYNTTFGDTTVVTVHFKCPPCRRGFNVTTPRVACLCVNLLTVCPKGSCPAETGRVCQNYFTVLYYYLSGLCISSDIQKQNPVFWEVNLPPSSGQGYLTSPLDQWSPWRIKDD